MLFSYRNHLVDDRDALIRFRNRVWNNFDDLLNVFNGKCMYYSELNYYDIIYPLVHRITDKLGLFAADKTPFSIYRNLKSYVLDFDSLNLIFDFIESHLEALSSITLPNMVISIDLESIQETTVKTYSDLLKDENQPYRLYNNHIIPLVSDVELEEINAASETCYESVNTHIAKAWSLFSNRKKPDFVNSIKESISAVESMCCIITGMTGAQATLGKALKKLKESGVHIHSAMENAFSSLYGYTSDENGIRHGGIDFTSAPAEDAKYMLISCSAFVNYLIEKWEKINPKE